MQLGTQGRGSTAYLRPARGDAGTFCRLEQGLDILKFQVSDLLTRSFILPSAWQELLQRHHVDSPLP